jgi:hypothetical protein
MTFKNGSEPNRFESSAPCDASWKVNPLDPRPKEFVIKYLAFDSPPDLPIRQRLKLIFNEESVGIWAYELP